MTMLNVYTRQVAFTGGTSSSIVPTDGGALVGVYIPAGMAGTALQLEATNGNQANEAGVPVPVFDSTGVRIGVNISTAAGYRLFDQTRLTMGADFVRLVSSANETATCFLMFQKVC